MKAKFTSNSYISKLSDLQKTLREKGNDMLSAYEKGDDTTEINKEMDRIEIEIVKLTKQIQKSEGEIK